jgi:hypothetical protein
MGMEVAIVHESPQSLAAGESANLRAKGDVE